MAIYLCNSLFQWFLMWWSVGYFKKKRGPILPYIGFVHVNGLQRLKSQSDSPTERILANHLNAMWCTKRRSSPTCVAMPAWSQPGTHSTLWPCILRLGDTHSVRTSTWHSTCCSSVSSYHRTRASSTATVRAWPRCRLPVTLGGGIHREKVWSTAWGNLSWGTSQYHKWEILRETQTKYIF